jgi:hypothetical protein
MSTKPRAHVKRVSGKGNGAGNLVLSGDKLRRKPYQVRVKRNTITLAEREDGSL